MVSLAGTKPACRRGKTTISILGEKYGREIQTEKIEKEIQMKQFVSVFFWDTHHETTVTKHTHTPIFWKRWYQWRSVFGSNHWQMWNLKKENWVHLGWRWNCGRREHLEKGANPLQPIFTFSIGKVSIFKGNSCSRKRWWNFETETWKLEMVDMLAAFRPISPPFIICQKTNFSPFYYLPENK